jgi:hypothetical protein
VITHKVNPRTLATLDVGDILDIRGQHPARVVAIDYFAGTATVKPIGWLGRLWLRLTGVL